VVKTICPDFDFGYVGLHVFQMGHVPFPAYEDTSTAYSAHREEAIREKQRLRSRSAKFRFQGRVTGSGYRTS
jgi:hypothetical protein